MAEYSDIYPFKSVIFTLYAIEWDAVSVLKFCEDSGVRFITMKDSSLKSYFIIGILQIYRWLLIPSMIISALMSRLIWVWI